MRFLSVSACVSFSSRRWLSGFGRPCHALASWGWGGVGRERTHVTLEENWRPPKSRLNPTPDLSLDAETVIIVQLLRRCFSSCARLSRMASSSQSVSTVESAKRAAAYAAVDAYVKPHHQLIGIGSGSTVPYVVERIYERGEKVNNSCRFVPTSFQAKNLILERNLNLGDMDTGLQLDVTIDGADEVDASLNLIKGGGACHLREKVLAEAAKEFVVVADFRKMSMVLGENWRKGVPVEVAPFAAKHVLKSLERLGSTDAKLRMAVAKAGPVVTDNGNLCIDAVFPESIMRNPDHLLKQIKLMTGVVEVGIFTNICKAAYFGNEDGSITRQLPDGSRVRM